MKKERLFYLDFIRVIAMVMIVLYHFGCHFETFNIQGFHGLFYQFANGDFGKIGVTLFFMISGASLMYNYQGKMDNKQFLEKRAKGIFPMFYLAYLFVFLLNFYQTMTIPNLPKSRILLTFLGMDGYFSYLIPNFYLIGEWFLGAIIFLYLLFPVMRKLVKKFPIVTIVTLGILNFLIILKNPFMIEANRNIMVCLFSFTLGMMAIYYQDKIKKQHFIIGMVVSLIILFVPISSNIILMSNLLGYITFVNLVWLAKWVRKDKIKNVFYQISPYCYPVFLVHHYIILKVEEHFIGKSLSITESFCMLLICVILITIASIVLYKVTNYFVKKKKTKELRLENQSKLPDKIQEKEAILNGMISEK